MTAGCKLSGNRAAWHEACGPRMKPLPFLCLCASVLGRLRAALALLSPVPGVHRVPLWVHLYLFQGTADPMLSSSAQSLPSCLSSSPVLKAR